jgi:cytochrome c oxidase accessory protein FixG
VIPGEVAGPFRKKRDWVNLVLIAIFLGLPWLKIGGLQSVWLDIPNRRFELFGKLFLAHDAPLVFLILMIAAMALAFVTAVWGRVWCGWACPQTVFIDGVYRKIEIWIEGNYIQRRRLHSGPLTAERIRKSTLKWAAYFLMSSVFAHSFIAYFAGADNLVKMIGGSPSENWSYFLIVTSITALLLFNFGWFREQFCTIMCPYGRFQSVLMDSQSLAIQYDETRGEPRKKGGDCVACNRCVEVCPAGIDIRKGLQMECIACTACIDACNVIMAKVNKPLNLISYRNVRGTKLKIWRPRTVAYFAIAMICAIVLAISFAEHAPYSATFLRAKDVPYQILADDKVLNHFKAHILNQSQDDLELEIQLPPENANGTTLTQSQPSFTLKPGSSVEAHLFLTFPKSIVAGHGTAKISLGVLNRRSGETTLKEISLVGPQ